MGLKNYAITAEIKKYNIGQYLRKRKKHDKTALIAKDTLNSIEVLICKALI